MLENSEKALKGICKPTLKSIVMGLIAWSMETTWVSPLREERATSSERRPKKTLKLFTSLVVFHALSNQTLNLSLLVPHGW
jgi:hypothetical protein